MSSCTTTAALTCEVRPAAGRRTLGELETGVSWDAPAANVIRQHLPARDVRERHLLFQLAGSRFALPIRNVREVRSIPLSGSQPNGLAAKVAAGAGFAQTQFCMDTAIARRYVARLAEHGLGRDRIALIIGVVPLKSAKSAAWIKNHLYGSIIPDALVTRMQQAADPAAEGRRICIEVIEELAVIPGVAGAHIMAPGNDAAAVDVLAAVRKPDRM